MTLVEKQQLFPKLIKQLIQFLENNGYELTFGEAWRPAEMAAYYAAKGKGISNSLHCSRLALDINLFKGGKLLILTPDYEEAGKFWESLNPLCTWGGHFQDGNHFSLTHGGVR